jgi:apolipoprotein N-acyltransferase
LSGRSAPERAGTALRTLALAASLGALHSLPFVHTTLWWLQPLAVGGLAALVAGASIRRAAALGWVFGAAWLLAGVWWLFISMHRYGGLPAPLAALAVLLLAAALGGYLALAMVLFARARSGNPVGDGLRFAGLWLGAELARGLLFTGFPWLASGYAHVDGPLARLAPWIGVYGIGTFSAFVVALLAFAARPRVARGSAGLALVTAAAVFGAAAMLGRDGFTRSAGSIGVSLIQTNVPQDQKFSAEQLPQSLAWLAGALSQAPGPLVVAPETAIPLLPAQLDAESWHALTGGFSRPGRAGLVGLPLGSFAQGYTNSVAGLEADGSYRYDKHHLVPFGEFIPTGFRWFVNMMNIPLGDFDRGPLAAPSFDALGQRIAPNICYEDLFGEELGARFADEAKAPTLFANVSNIGRFGNTIAIPQHLNISRMRSLEFERAMLRATNTGATAIVDHHGRVVQELRPFTLGVLDGAVEGRDGLTPYAKWVSRLGLWPLNALAMAAVVACVLGARRRPGP